MDTIKRCLNIVKKYFNIAKEFVIKHYKIILPVALACVIIIPILVINAKEPVNQTKDKEVVAEVEETTEKVEEETTEEVVEETTEQVEEQQIEQTNSNGEPAASPNLPEGKRYWNPQPAYWEYEDGRRFLPDGTEIIDRKNRILLYEFPQFKAAAGIQPNGLTRWGFDLYNFLLTYGTRKYHAMTGDEINEILGIDKGTYPMDEYIVDTLNAIEGTATHEGYLRNEDDSLIYDENGEPILGRVPTVFEESHILRFKPIRHVTDEVFFCTDSIYIIYNGELMECFT